MPPRAPSSAKIDVPNRTSGPVNALVSTLLPNTPARGPRSLDDRPPARPSRSSRVLDSAGAGRGGVVGSAAVSWRCDAGGSGSSRSSATRSVSASITASHARASTERAIWRSPSPTMTSPRKPFAVGWTSIRIALPSGARASMRAATSPCEGQDPPGARYSTWRACAVDVARSATEATTGRRSEGRRHLICP